jgi:hypothetical protein
MNMSETTTTANWEAAKRTNVELSQWLEKFANENKGGILNYEHANIIEAARRLRALEPVSVAERLPTHQQKVLLELFGDSESPYWIHARFDYDAHMFLDEDTDETWRPVADANRWMPVPPRIDSTPPA